MMQAAEILLIVVAILYNIAQYYTILYNIATTYIIRSYRKTILFDGMINVLSKFRRVQRAKEGKQDNGHQKNNNPQTVFQTK